MAQKSGFFTSNNGDRKYTADWLAQYVAGIISNGVYTTELTVSGGNGDMSVTVAPGRAWINGYMYSNDAALTLPLGAADGALSRTDTVVLRLDMTNRQITLIIVQGDFGGGIPVLTRNADIYELALAEIAIAAGTTEITAQMITDKRADETVCGIVAGAVTQLSTGELLEQLKAGFDEWFENIKGQLSEDAAGNLQNEIENLHNEVNGITPESIGASTDKIGDIKQTVHTDLGKDWALCNGAVVEKDIYPDLYTITPNDPSTMQLDYLGKESGFCGNRVKYANGYTVICGTIYNGSTYYPAILYKADNEETFHMKQVYGSNGRICYDFIWNGTYFVAYFCTGSSGSVSYCETIDGTYSYISISSDFSAGSEIMISDAFNTMIFHIDGSANTIKLHYASNTDLTSWLSNTVDSSIGYPAYFGYNQESAEYELVVYYNKIYRKYVSTSILSGYTLAGTISVTQNFKPYSLYCGVAAIKSNRYFVIAGRFELNDGFPYTLGYILISEDFSEILEKPAIDYSADCYLLSPVELNGKYYFGSYKIAYGSIFVTDDLTDATKLKQLKISGYCEGGSAGEGSDLTRQVLGMSGTHFDNFIIASSQDLSQYPNATFIKQPSLPLITPHGAYAYIKIQ